VTRSENRLPTSSSVVDDPRSAEPDGTPGLVGWLGVTVCTAAAVLAALVESMLIPYYVGAVLVPLAPVAAVASNVFLPRLGHQALSRTLGAVLPYVGWLLAVIAFAGFTRPEGDVIYPGGGGWMQWAAYGVLLGGGTAGAVTIALTLNPPARRVR
jgi:hypothetical protein